MQRTLNCLIYFKNWNSVINPLSELKKNKYTIMLKSRSQLSWNQALFLEQSSQTYEATVIIILHFRILIIRFWNRKITEALKWLIVSEWNEEKRTKWLFVIWDSLRKLTCWVVKIETKTNYFESVFSFKSQNDLLNSMLKLIYINIYL